MNVCVYLLQLVLQPGATLPTDTVFVAGISEETTEDEVKHFFENMGPVKESRILNDLNVAFVIFERRESCDKTISKYLYNL
jgi:RNA recognition motif-containing protein